MYTEILSKKRQVEDDIAAIRVIGRSPEQYDLKRDLAPYFLHKSNHAIAAAADVAGRLEAETLVPELTAAFLELIKNAHARDPGCKAMIAIAGALAGMSVHAPAVFEKGIAHVQKEGSFGPPVDAALHCAACALAVWRGWRIPTRCT